MRNSAIFVRSTDRPLPASILWLGVTGLCVNGKMDWSKIRFRCLAAEDATSVAYYMCRFSNNDSDLDIDAPFHLDLESMPSKNFTGHVYLGAWTLVQLRDIRVRAAFAEDHALAKGLIDSVISSFKGETSPWLAISVCASGAVDQFFYARDVFHAAKLALDLPGKLEALLSVSDLTLYIQQLEVAAHADPYSAEALTFLHRTATEGEIELQEFSANYQPSGVARAFVTAALGGLPFPAVDVK